MEESAAFELFPSDAGAGLESRLMEGTGESVGTEKRRVRLDILRHFSISKNDAPSSLRLFSIIEQANQSEPAVGVPDGRIRSRVNRPSQTSPVIVPSVSRVASRRRRRSGIASDGRTRESVGTGGRRSRWKNSLRVNRPSRTTPAVIVPSVSSGNFQTLAPVLNRSQWKNRRIGTEPAVGVPMEESARV